MVCSGPRAIAVAARLADRIGLSVGANPDRIKWALKVIDAGTHEAGRSRDEIRIGAFLPVAITTDRATGRQAIRPRTAGWAHMSSFKGNDLSQQPEIMRRVTSVLRDTYDYRYHHPGAAAAEPEHGCVRRGVRRLVRDRGPAVLRRRPHRRNGRARTRLLRHGAPGAGTRAVRRRGHAAAAGPQELTTRRESRSRRVIPSPDQGAGQTEGLDR